MIHLEMRNLEQNLEHPMVAIFLCFKAYHVQHVGIHDCVFLDFFPHHTKGHLSVIWPITGKRGEGAECVHSRWYYAVYTADYWKNIIFNYSVKKINFFIRPWYAFTTHLTFVTNLESFASSTECWFLPFSRKAGIWYSYPITLKASKTSLKPLSTTQTSPAWKNSFVSMIWRVSSASLCLPSLWYGDS